MAGAVSVVIPCYNCGASLGRALQSVLTQTYRDFQFVVIDDGSSGDTEAAVQPYAQYGSWVGQPHAGAAAARNRGIGMSASPYVAFLDADDRWLAQKLERQVALLESDPQIGLVCSDFSIEGPASLDSYFSRTGLPPRERVFKELLRNCFVFTSSVVVRRKCLEDVGFFNEALAVSEDFNLWLRIALRWKIAAVPEVLVVKHNRAEGLSMTSFFEQRWSNGLAALQHVKGLSQRMSSSERKALERAIAEMYYVRGSECIVSGERSASRVHFKTALRHYPLHGRAILKWMYSFVPA